MRGVRRSRSRAPSRSPAPPSPSPRRTARSTRAARRQPVPGPEQRVEYRCWRIGGAWHGMEAHVSERLRVHPEPVHGPEQRIGKHGVEHKSREGFDVHLEAADKALESGKLWAAFRRARAAQDVRGIRSGRRHCWQCFTVPRRSRGERLMGPVPRIQAPFHLGHDSFSPSRQKPLVIVVPHAERLEVADEVALHRLGQIRVLARETSPCTRSASSPRSDAC